MPVELKLDIKDSGEKRGRVILKGLKAQDKAFLEVGIFEEEVTQDDEQIANYGNNNEFGIGVPERSFMRTSFDENLRKVQDRAVKQERLVIAGRKTARGALESIGLDMQKNIVKKIRSNIPPPNSAQTEALKGSTKTLRDTGALLGSIVVKVTMGGQKRSTVKAPKAT